MASTYVEDLAELTALIAEDGPLDGCKAALYTAGPTPAPDMTLGAFTLATFTGSTPKAVTWGTPYTGPDGQPRVDSQLMNWVVSGGVIFENIVGILIINAGATAVMYALKFESPIPLPVVGAGFANVWSQRRYDTENTLVT